MFTGKKLRLLRIARQIKQKEMARKLGVTQQRYSALENSSAITEEKFKAILKILKVSKPEAEKIFAIFSPTAINEKVMG